MKKSSFLAFVLGLTIFLSGTSAQAASIEVSPVSQNIQIGNPVDVDLTISGLGDFAPDSLSTFDLDLLFDSSILGFNSVAFGDPVLGDQLDLFGLGSLTSFDDSVSGVVNLFELSFDLPGDLDTLQAGSFTLATLTFDTLGLGTSSLDLSINALGDAFGDPLVADLSSGSVTVVPEPSTMLLLGSGLAGLGFFRRRRKAA